MEGPVAVKLDELNNVIELINKVFRISGGHSPTMKEEFPALLNKDNIDNITIVKEGGVPVSVVSYLPWDILIEGTKISSASIGAVCTDEEYRGKGYSSKILDYVEEKIKKEDIDILLVSGIRDLYKRRGLVEVESFIEHKVSPESIGLDFQIIEYEDKYLSDLMNMYSKNSTRYFRTKDEFETLIDSATIPWGLVTYKKYVIVKNEKVIGYIIFRLISNKKAEVVEYFGNNDTILKTIKSLAEELELENIIYANHIKDYKNNQYTRESIINNEGTIKIMNFVGFMNKLKTYFSQYVSTDTTQKLEFIEDENKYYIKIEDEKLCIEDVRDVTKLVFEGHTSDIDLEDTEKIKKFIDSVFPIPFVWTKNLNYQ